MKKNLDALIRRVLLLIALVLCMWMGYAQVANPDIVKGKIKVKFESTMSESLAVMKIGTSANARTTNISAFNSVAARVGATTIYRLFPYDEKNEQKLVQHGLHLWYVIELDEKSDAKRSASEFGKLPEIEIAEVEYKKVLAPYKVKEYSSNKRVQSNQPFNDPLLADQWHYNNDGYQGTDADANVFAAWNVTTGASNIIVSVHDEGVDVNHQDLNANMWVNLAELNGQPGVDDDGNGFVDDVYGYNFDKNRGAIDPQYHGTHVAGTVAAVNNNGIGVAGVAGGNGTGNGARIMSLQIMGGGSIERSYLYAAHNGAVISQNSWGYSSPYYVEQSVLDAIDYFIAEAGNYPGSPMRGGLVIFAAGNNDWDAEWYPAYHPNVMAVAATGPDGRKAGYSNYGDWIEVSAPGGDVIAFGSKGGVLSTIPANKYGFLDGTSMACPHVSGIAALALASSTRQLTTTELWNKLVTGVQNTDEINEGYEGKLGSGAIDALLAIQNDAGIAPMRITDLTVAGIAQEFANLSWSVPVDADDDRPLRFHLYYHTQPITSTNLTSATKIDLPNIQSAGSSVSYEVQGLLGLTTYYFGITAIDRWGNASLLSNVVTETTNAGPAIAVDEASQFIEITIDADQSTFGTHPITLINGAEGILRWNHFMRHSITNLSYDLSNFQMPILTSAKRASDGKVAMRHVVAERPLKSNAPVPFAFQSVEKSYADWPTNIIGETDLNLTNSAAAKFVVTEEEGFNLTQMRMYLKHDPAKGPVIMEVYQGASPTKNYLIYAQEHSNWSAAESFAYITLNEQLYFETNTTFWVVFHVPAGNLYPLGIGWETDPAQSQNSLISFDLGSTWTSLDNALNHTDFAWAMTAASYNAHLGTYLTLEPGSGDVAGFEQMETLLTADASTLINGTYSANVIIASNDAANRDLRLPVNLTVSGHQPNIQHIDIADFGAVFRGTSKTLEVVLENVGYGNYNEPYFSIDNPEFTIEGGSPWQIGAREEVVLNIKFSPTGTGNTNGILTIDNGMHIYQIALFGVSAETSEIVVSPEYQVVENVTIGDVVHAQLTIENAGAYPLKYFIPGFDTKGISTDWPSDYHSYGYAFRSNDPSVDNPIDYAFQDISTTGTDITEIVKEFGAYATVEMGFDFPYYGQSMHTLYVARQGFTTFDNTVQPLNIPRLGSSWDPRGYISPLGTFVDLTTQGELFYQIEPDRVIVQWHNVTDGYSGVITAQMVLYSTGDIRFFYDNMGYDEWAHGYLTILIEDLDHLDGILVHDDNNPISLYSGLALGFDYPGPDIISAITNGSGLLSPGHSAVLDITLQTDGLVEGVTNRYINIVSNDPFNAQSTALVQLEITDGGVPNPLVSVDEIAFGDVFRGAVRTVPFTIKNTGTADVEITSIALENDQFIFTGPQPTTIVPGLYKSYQVTVPTDVNAELVDILTIQYVDGSAYTIRLNGQVIDPPAIVIDLTPIDETLAFGEQRTYPLTVENNGLAPLAFTASGKHWLSFTADVAPDGTSYVYEKYNQGEFYQWIDIRETGTQMPFAADLFDPADYWRDLTLPFPFTFYGQEYHQIKIGDNGLVSFDENPEVMVFTDVLPTTSYSGAFIMPYWAFGGFPTYYYPEDEVGIFYQMYEDKVIITWSYLLNYLGGMGDPVSAQLILYANGSMKFQYRPEESGTDLTSQFTMIGVQRNSEEAVAISQINALDHGNGLAYFLIPTDSYEIAPGSTLAGTLTIDAGNVFGGAYSEALTIQTNVPGSEQLEKWVNLAVLGEAIPDLPASIEFGTHMIELEWGMPVSTYQEMVISNSGSAPFDISWAQMTDGYQGLSLQIFTVVDGWFGPELRWADISELYSPWNWNTPTFRVNPGDRLKARASFGPSYAADFADMLTLTTSIGDIEINMTGTGIEPPVLAANTDMIVVEMNTVNETATRSIAFNNMYGASDLHYELSIDFGRAATTQVSISTSSSNQSVTHALKAGVPQAMASSTSALSTDYNRILTHTASTFPDTFVGTGGTAPFTLATRYNAGSEGFNLSHVQAWFRPESLANGTIELEIRAGGTSIENAVLLGSAEKNFAASGSDQVGDWFEMELDQPVGIYPNEDFYVVVTYPLGIQLPQGTVTNEQTVSGRYYYSFEGAWYDIQTVATFETMGWLMYAAEMTAGNSSWLTIASPLFGTIAAGEEGTIELLFEGAFAKRGDQIASVIISSNDLTNAAVAVPVMLHVNEAPAFMTAATSVSVAEAASITLTIPVQDPEDNSFSVASNYAMSWVSHTFEEDILTLTIAPQYGDAGAYTATFEATDEFGAVRSYTLELAVQHTNRAPAFIGSSDGIAFTALNKFTEYAIADFFADPDGDAMTFSASTVDDVVGLFSSNNTFIVKTIAFGETLIDFVVIDSHGAQTSFSMPLRVDIIASAADLEYDLSIYPNPTSGTVILQLDGKMNNSYGVRVVDVSGVIRLEKQQIPAQNRKLELDLSVLSTGIYFVEIISQSGNTTSRIFKQ